jgi:REP-associated tyrosine transposase
VALVRTLEQSFAAMRDRGRFRVVHYALQSTHAHLLVEASDANALAYVLLNARHDARRLVGTPRIDPASSARWFDGWSRQPAIDGRASAVTPVVRARTWLLTIGWRRHGLIDPDEVPGSPPKAAGAPVIRR